MDRQGAQSIKHLTQPPPAASSKRSWMPRFLCTSKEAKKPLGHGNQLGLFRLYKLPDPSLPSTPISTSTSTYNADVIAIHGLGGTPYRSWTHDNGKLWLRDFALDRFPGARIYTFGYESRVAFSNGTGTLRDFARGLLEAIKLERRSPEVCSFR